MISRVDHIQLWNDRKVRIADKDKHIQNCYVTKTIYTHLNTTWYTIITSHNVKVLRLHTCMGAYTFV